MFYVDRTSYGVHLLIAVWHCLEMQFYMLSNYPLVTICDIFLRHRQIFFGPIYSLSMLHSFRPIYLRLDSCDNFLILGVILLPGCCQNSVIFFPCYCGERVHFCSWLLQVNVSSSTLGSLMAQISICGKSRFMMFWFRRSS